MNRDRKHAHDFGRDAESARRAGRESPCGSAVTRRACLLGCGALAMTRRARGDDSVDAALSRIARARASFRTLRGPFTQTRTIGLLATQVRSHGTLILVRPDRLRWDLDPPDAVTFWIGPEGLAYRSAHDQGRVDRTTAQIASSLDDVRALVGGDLTRLRERWILAIVRDDATGVELRAEAREPDAADPRQMTLALAADRVRPTRALLATGARDKTAIDFGALVVDAPVDEALMRLPSY